MKLEHIDLQMNMCLFVFTLSKLPFAFPLSPPQQSQGWTYGAGYSERDREHSNLRPLSSLPAEVYMYIFTIDTEEYGQ